MENIIKIKSLIATSNLLIKNRFNIEKSRQEVNDKFIRLCNELYALTHHQTKLLEDKT